MLDAQRSYARRGPSVRASGSAALGCALFDLLPEDRFDAQPYVGGGGRCILVADARLDNRDELLGQLGLPAGTEISDSELLSRAYAQWGDRLYEKAIGDFAVAVWDAHEQSLTLARDPAGQRPLHYHIGEGFVALATMPQGLHALREVERVLDPERLALFVSDVPLLGSNTYFKGVARVEPGRLVKINRLGVTSRLIWEMPGRELRFQKQNDYVEAFREQLERAIASRLRGSRGVVAAHLSAGLDSGAVAATAAKIQPASKVVAITSAPRFGFSGPSPKGWIADESGYASETAAMYPNIEHVVLRSAGTSPVGPLEADGCLYQQPVGLPCNHTWWSAASEAASARGISVLLTGEAGNLTISAGGMPVLADLVRTGRWGSWRREAKAFVDRDDSSWRGVLAASFGPWLPRPAWNGVMRLASGRGGSAGGVSLLSPEWRSQIEKVAESNARAGRPVKDSRLARWKMLQMTDPGNFRKGTLGRWGVDERNPTADRRVVEFCFSLPPGQLLGGGISRRLARLALADRLPPSVLEAPRGYQFADWYEAIDRAGLDGEIDRLQSRLGASSVIDFDRVRSLAASWPPGDWGSGEVIGTYRITLLHALSAAAFASGACQ